MKTAIAILKLILETNNNGSFFSGMPIEEPLNQILKNKNEIQITRIFKDLKDKKKHINGKLFLIENNTKLVRVDNLVITEEGKEFLKKQKIINKILKGIKALFRIIISKI